jgi:hypothetical protein
MGSVIKVVAGYALAAYGAFTNNLQLAKLGVAIAVSGIISGVTDILTPDAEQSSFSPGAQERQGIMLNKQANDAAIPVVYGSRQVGGVRVLRETSGANNDYLNLVIVLCEGEISAINTVYLDGVATSDARFSGLVDVYKHVGTDAQAADSNLVSEVAAWTTAHKLSGVAYIYLRLKWDGDAFGGIPTVTADVDGKLVYDFRDTTTKFSDNPVLCAYDYCTNSRYGRGIAAADMDTSAMTAEANHCDTSEVDPDTTRNRYTCNGVINTDLIPFENIKKILSSCRGSLAWSAGKYKVLVDRTTSTTFALTEDNIVGRWNFSPFGKQQKFNRITARFFNPSRNWQADRAIYDNSTARSTNDNNLLLEKEIELPLTSNIHTAERIGQIEGKKSRSGIRVELTATIAARRCEVGDVVSLTHTVPGWTAKAFRVLAVILQPNDEVRLKLESYTAADYTTSGLVAADATPSTNLPNPFNITDPTVLVLSSGTADLLSPTDGTVISRIKATWTDSADAFVDKYELQFKKSADSDWIPGGKTDKGLQLSYISPVDDGVAYDVRIRAINNFGVKGGWVTPGAGAHTVIGKTAPPSDVSNFSASQNGNFVTFQWDQVSDADLAGYEIRFGPVAGFSWASASIVTSVTKGTKITNGVVPPGSWKLAIKALDTSLGTDGLGNESVNEATFDLTITNTNNIINSKQASPRWPGTKSGCHVHDVSGSLVPNSTTTAAAEGYGLFNEYIPNSVLNFYYETEEFDIGFDNDVRVWSDIEALIGPDESGVAAPVFKLDYKVDGGSYDGFENWSSGQVTARYLKARVYLDTTTGKASVRSFERTSDVEERTESAAGVVVAQTTGKVVTFTKQFNNIPAITVTAQGGSALFPVISSISGTGFTINIYDSAGVDQGGTADWIAMGA